MSRHNVRVKTSLPNDLKKIEAKVKVDVRPEKRHMFTKIVIEKQVLRERYIKLMNDAERAVGRKEAINLFRDAEIIWQKING